MVDKASEFGFRVRINNTSKDGKIGDTRIFAFEATESELEYDYKYMHGAFQQGEQTTEVEFQFKDKTQYYLAVEIDWISDTAEKTLTIECTNGSQKVDF